MNNASILRAIARTCALWLALVGLACPASTPASAPLPTTTPTTQKGVALGLFASDPGYDYGPLLQEIKATGATDVLIAVVWAQQRIDSVRIHRSQRPTTMSPTDSTVLRTLQQAQAVGLSTTLFPIVRLEEHRPDEWRGRIAPLAGVDAWFSSYRDFIAVMADLAARGGAKRFSVGSELLSLEQHEGHWRSLIADVRRRFGGLLLYSSNWDHYQAPGFWDAVDELGITAYFELSGDPQADADVDDEQLHQAWQGPRRELLAFAHSQHKPLVLTEVGYPSITTAAWHPWDETARVDGRVAFDFGLQARLYEAFCESWKRTDIAGFYVWNWFGFGGDNDSGYTPRGKPAARTLARCLKDPAWGSLSEASGGTRAP